MTTGVILGAAVWANGPSPTLLRRTRHGAALFHEGRISRIIVCGGLGKHPPTEAEAMANILRNHGVPDSAIFLEGTSTTTKENITNAMPMLDGSQIIIITDWYHAPRARLIARRAGLSVRTSSPSLRGARMWPQIKATLREIVAYLAYLTRFKS